MLCKGAQRGISQTKNGQQFRLQIGRRFLFGGLEMVFLSELNLIINKYPLECMSFFSLKFTRNSAFILNFKPKKKKKNQIL